MAPPLRRRRFLGLVAGSGSVLAAGCLGGDGAGDPTTESPDSSQVTTTAGGDVEILLAQIVVRSGDEGPHVYYQLRNDGAQDATIAVRTVFTVDEGGTYEATAYTDVSAGEEAVLEYRLVRFDELTPAERENVRQGNADFETYVNGERRAV